MLTVCVSGMREGEETNTAGDVQSNRSPDDSAGIADLVLRAAEGDRAALDEVLDRYRGYLRGIAARRISAPLGRRLDASDLVQETLLEAHRDGLEVFAGGEPHVRAALRRILRCNIANAIRDHVAAKRRSLRREQPVDDHANALARDSSSPSVNLARGEMTARFLEIIDGLPSDQSDAVRMRYFEGRSVGEIAESLSRSRSAAAGLLKRGLKTLRSALAGEESLWERP